ncbi:Grx4 family monothiol glutaredoxin [Tistrella mobilis]|uniref:Grx4 family monothiol glutaredoxin n=1 Tax=Tistrella mobilis TaxID=171437 RepID=UPI003556871E
MTDQSNPVFDEIQSHIDAEPVVLFMKGTADRPMCGFSAKVVQVLNYMGVPFRDVNVLADGGIREGIKQYSNWPTIPQLYVKGEFVGGCDIVSEMFETGELSEYLNGQGIDARQVGVR